MAGRSRPPAVGGARPERRPWHSGLSASLVLHLFALALIAWITWPTAERVTEDERATVVRLDLPELEQPQLPPAAPSGQAAANVEPPRSRPQQPPSPNATGGKPPEHVPEPPGMEEPRAAVAPPTPPLTAEEESLPEVPEPVGSPAIDESETGRPVAPSAANGARRLDLERALREFRRERVDSPPSNSSAVRGSPGGSQGLEPTGLSPGGFGMDTLSFESTDFDWNDYRRQIYWAIWRAWHWRLFQTTNEFDRWAFAQNRWYLDHMSQIRFVIERSGDVTGVVVERGSGCAPLDSSAVDALLEVNLPPLPAAFPREREVVHARFIAIADIRVMRRSLQAQHQRGDFP